MSIETNKEDSKIECLVCGAKMYKITHTHLWKHNLTMEDYKLKFPNAVLEDPIYSKSKGNSTRGRTYEDIYGKEKAKELRDTRSKSTTEQMKDSKQIEVRSEKCGKFEWTDKMREDMSEKNTITGATNYRHRALQHYGAICERCGEEDEKKLVVHHKNFLNINTVLGDHSLDNLMVLCKSCHAKLHNSIKLGGFTGIPNVEKGMHYILKGLNQQFGLDLTDENFKDTPKRVARAYYEIFEGINSEEIENILSTSFPSQYNGMVVIKDIQCFSMCPHHFLPVEYHVNFGYIPGERVLGISKLARLVTLLGKQPMLQEDFTKAIVDILEKYIKPQGSIVQIKGKHMCMVMRGAEQRNAWTLTSAIRGNFTEAPIREEFALMIK